MQLLMQDSAKYTYAAKTILRMFLFFHCYLLSLNPKNLKCPNKFNYDLYDF